jgi:hypothetical protein
MFFLNADDDWIEALRRWLWPKLHPILKRYTGYGAVGSTHESQFAGTVRVNEQTLEEILVDLGFERNAPAYLKSTKDGRVSEGSWALRGEDDEYALIDGDEQLHVTLYEPRDGSEGREVYAHAELDWQDDPVGHLEEESFRPAPEMVTFLMNEHTHLKFKEA